MKQPSVPPTDPPPDLYTAYRANGLIQTGDFYLAAAFVLGTMLTAAHALSALLVTPSQTHLLLLGLCGFCTLLVLLVWLVLLVFRIGTMALRVLGEVKMLPFDIMKFMAAKDQP